MVKTVVFGSDTAEFFLRFVLLEKIGLGGGRELVYNLFHVHCEWFLSIIHSFTEGFATVHKGLDRLNNSFVAIKVRHSFRQNIYSLPLISDFPCSTGSG